MRTEAGISMQFAWMMAFSARGPVRVERNVTATFKPKLMSAKRKVCVARIRALFVLFFVLMVKFEWFVVLLSFWPLAIKIFVSG